MEWNQISPRRSSLTQILLLQLHRACQRSRNCFIFRPGPREQCSFPWLHSMEVHCVLIRSSLKQLLRQELKKKVNDTIIKPKRVKERLFFFFFLFNELNTNGFGNQSLRLSARCVACSFLIRQQKRPPMVSLVLLHGWSEAAQHPSLSSFTDEKV